jgi:hypothetical protein
MLAFLVIAFVPFHFNTPVAPHLEKGRFKGVPPSQS